MVNDATGRLGDLLAWAEQLLQVGSWEYVPSEGELLWSDNVYRILGLEPGAIEPSTAYFVAQTHPDDRARLIQARRMLVEHGDTRPAEYRITRPDGARRTLRSTVAVAERRDDQPYRFVGVLQDITDRRHAEREIAAHVAVEEALADWDAVDSGAHHLLVRLADALDCVAGVFWVPRDDVLVPLVVWHETGAESPFEARTRARPLRRGDGLAGRVWEVRAPLSWTLANTAPAGSADPAVRTVGLSGAIAVPALVGEDVLAVVELDADRELRIGERLMRSLIGISHELGHFLARRGGELAGPRLTPREVEVLQLAADGLSAPKTAERLYVSPGTVRTHLENIYRKLEVSDKPSAVATSLRLGLIN